MYSTGHAGMEGHAPAWYVRYLTTSEGLLLFLAAIQMARGCYQRSKPTMLISVFSIGYFLFVCRYAVRNDRTILPLIPCLALLSSFFLAEPYKESISSRLGRWRYILPVGLTALSLTILIANTVRDTIKLKTPDGRTTARIWIDGQLPAGSKIAIEKYAPYISSARFSISGLPMLVDHPLEWYRQNKFAYVVFSQGMYGRFFGDKKRYKFIVRQYTSLFEQLRPVKMFDDGGYEVRVYAVNPASTEVAH
jgi:hypothetical protein